MKTNQHKLTLVALVSVFLFACQDSAQKPEEVSQQNTPKKESSSPAEQIEQQSIKEQQEESDAIKQLEWVLSADVEKDFSEAIQKKDFHVWVIADRATTMPGIEVSQQAEITKKCKHKYLPGVGDTLRGDTHRDYRKKAVEYAAKYNQKMQAICLPQNP